MAMHALMPLLEQAFVNALLSRQAPLMRKNKWGFGLFLLASVLGAMALIFGVYAGYTWLLTQFPKPEAALYSALGVLLVALLLALIGLIILRSRRRKRQSATLQKDDVKALMALASEALAEEMAEPIQKNPKTALFIASIAGYAAGEKINTADF